MVKKVLKICLFVLSECTNVSDGRTYRHRMTAKAALAATKHSDIDWALLQRRHSPDWLHAHFNVYAQLKETCGHSIRLANSCEKRSKAASNVGPYGLFWQPALVCHTLILYMSLFIGQIKMLACLLALVNSSSPREKVLPWALFRVMAYACLSGYCLRSITSPCTSS